MRRWWFLLPLLLLVLAAAPAGASEPAAGGQDGGGGGLMTVDPLSVAVAMAVFLILLLVLTKVAWRPILDGLKAREATIQKAVDDAQAASQQAQAVMKEYEGRLAQAGEEARAILEEGKRDAHAVKAQIEAEARQAAEATTQRAVREIEQARVTAWDTIVRDAARLATETAARIIGKQLDSQGHAALVDQVVGKIQEARRPGKA